MRRFTALGRRLYVQVLVAITLGAAIGFVDPVLATSLQAVGRRLYQGDPSCRHTDQLYDHRRRHSQDGDLRQIARLGVSALVYFEVISTLAPFAGIAVGNLWPVGSHINPDPQAFDPKAVADFVNASPPSSLTGFLLNIVPATFLDPFIKGETLQILLVAVLFCIGAVFTIASAPNRSLICSREFRSACSACSESSCILLRSAPPGDGASHRQM